MVTLAIFVASSSTLTIVGIHNKCCTAASRELTKTYKLTAPYESLCYQTNEYSACRPGDIPVIQVVFNGIRKLIKNDIAVSCDSR